MSQAADRDGREPDRRRSRDRDRDDHEGPLGAPDHLHGDVPGPASPPRTREELEEALRGARRSRNGGLVAAVVGVAAMFLVPVRLLAILGLVGGFLGLLVVVVAAIQASVLEGTLAQRGADEEE